MVLNLFQIVYNFAASPHNSTSQIIRVFCAWFDEYLLLLGFVNVWLVNMAEKTTNDLLEHKSSVNVMLWQTIDPYIGIRWGIKELPLYSTNIEDETNIINWCLAIICIMKPLLLVKRYDKNRIFYNTIDSWTQDWAH